MITLLNLFIVQYFIINTLQYIDIGHRKRKGQGKEIL